MKPLDWPSLTPEQAPPLAKGDVHAWWCVGGARAVEQRRQYLDELLRRVLGAYLGQPPATVSLGRESRGRPFVSDAQGQPASPDFNLSDSGDCSLILVSRSLRVGVDIERANRRLRHRELAERYYAPAEAEALSRLDDESARQGFLRLWTTKEAACKATGTGLGGHMHRWVFCLEMDAGNDAAPGIIALPEDAGHADDWRILSLQPPEAGYIVTAALRGRFEKLHCFSLPPEVS